MRDGAMTALPWAARAVTALLALGVTADVWPAGGALNGTDEWGLPGDLAVPDGYNWQDYFLAVDPDTMFAKDAAREVGDSVGDGEEECPRVCTACGSEGHLRTYVCGTHELKYTEDGEGAYMEVVCRHAEVPVNCSQLPPGGALRRLEVTSCLLPPGAPLSCAAGGQGAHTLALQSARSSLSAENVRGLDAQELFLQFIPGACVEVPVEAMKALPRLREVRLQQGSALVLRPDMFLGAPPLTYLEISMSGVGDIPANAFRGLPHLETLSLFLNNITTVARDAFNGLHSLQKLVLNDNPLGALPPHALPPTLRTLLLERTALAALEGGVLAGLTQLQQLAVQSSAAVRLGGGALRSLPSLGSVSVCRCGVTSLPPDLFSNTTHVLDLTLSYNRLVSVGEEVFSGLGSLATLDLSHNLLAALSADALRPLAALRRLQLQGNQLRDLPPFVFASLGNLSSVSLAHNRLSSLRPEALAGARSLQHLSLSHNQLAWGEEEGDSSPFNSLLQLETVDLSYNNISVLFSDWRYILLRLRRLDLSHNHLAALSFADVDFCSGAEVDLRYNLISTVEPHVPGGAPSTPRAPRAPPAPRLLLDGNPFNCDCHLYEFLTLVQSGDKKYAVDGATCTAPASLAARPLRRADVRAVSCAVPAAPPGCLCLDRPATRTTHCVCNDTQVPRAADLTYGRVSLRVTRAPGASRLRRLAPAVTALNLSGLGVSAVPELPPSVRLLDLSDNSLRSVPARVWAAGRTLYLARNPLECTCAHADELLALERHRALVGDYGRVTCADGALVQHRDWRALCAGARSALVAALAAGGLLALAALAAALYRARVELQVVLHSRGWLTRLLPREKPDRKEFDVFVSFAPADESFVAREVLPRLAPRPLALLVRDRDWLVGHTIPAEIRRSVGASRRTLLVLSPSFLRSVWAGEELRALHAQAAADRRLRAVVLLRDLRAADLDTDTRALLSLARVLHYGERLFWEKVMYALPRHAPPPREGLEPAPEGHKAAGLQVVLNREGQLVNKAFVKDVD